MKIRVETFDGDEMNMHVPQSYESSVELENITAVPHQIITPRDPRPIIGVVQDTLVGSYRLTRPNTRFNLREYMNLMMYNKRFDGSIPKARAGTEEAPRWTGHQVISRLLPPINLEAENGMYDSKPEAENFVKIREGDVLQGTFDKGIFAKSSKGIIHTTYNDYGAKQTVDLIDSLQNTVESYLILDGFSVGISDLVADEGTNKEMQEAIEKRKKEVEEILLQVHLDLFDNNTGKTNQEELETKVFSALNKATDDSGNIGQKSLASENRMTAMVRAGSKGGVTNIAQMMACVGQQAVEGKRIPYGYMDRTLPHYKKYDDGAEARGFVESSFLRGLTPQEFFFHAMSGREGLIDTAVKTADTGYIQRQLVKAMEDIVVQHDGSVRDANMNIVQFHYGEDGVNSTKLEGQPLPLSKLTRADIEKTFGLQDVDFAAIFEQGLEREADADELAAYVQDVIADRKMLVEGVFGSGRQGGVHSPVNIERLMKNIEVRFGLTADAQTDLTPLYVLDGIKRLLDKTQSYNRVWAALLRFHLAPHNLIVKRRYTKKAFDTLIEMLLVKNWQSWVQPGELVGILAAQSIGEPSTQMSCVKDTFITITDGASFHYAGPIAGFIDRILEEGTPTVIGEDSVVLDMEKPYYIVGVSEDEKVSWRPISQVSRHPANGGLVKVTTKSGRSTTATLSHSFLKRTEKGIAPVLGAELAVGDRVPVARAIPEAPNALRSISAGSTVLTLDYELGWFCGIYLADGSINGQTVRITKIHPVVEDRIAALCSKYGWDYSVKHYRGEYGPSKDTVVHSKELRDFMVAEFGVGSYEKTVGAFVYQSAAEFIAGIVAGYFDGDGNVNVERQQIRAGSRSKLLIEHIARLLGYCGLFAVISEESSVRIPGKVMHTLNILKKYASAYKTAVGFQLPEKAAALDQVIRYMNRDNKHDTKDIYDKIPAVGSLIAETGRLLKMPGQSRNYGRWTKKESVGRATLAQYIADFKDMIALTGSSEQVDANIAALEAALAADVVWDEIVDLAYLADPKEYVYDFTVPGNDSFLVDGSLLVHNTLNTFHLAGVASKSNVTRGVPRLKELLKVTQNPKATSLTVYLRPEYRESKEKAREVAQDLEMTLLRDIVLKSGIFYDPSDEESVVEEDRELLAFYKMIEDNAVAEGQHKIISKYVLRMELDREKMFNKNITMNDVAFILGNKGSDIKLVYSDYNSKKLVMRVRIAGQAISGQIDYLEMFKRFQNNLLNTTVIRGVPGIKAVTFRQDSTFVADVDGKYESIQQYILDTDGSNYMEVMNHPAVDGNRLYSTNVHDIYGQLGVEATRAVLLNEIVTLFEEVGINFRHLGLLCDVMTRNGKLMSADRFGINKNDIGPIAKASFEETERILLRAALYGEVDPVTGVSANIMMGQPIRGGTAFSQIMLDEQALPKMLEGLKPIEELEEEEGDDLAELMGEDAMDACAVEKIQPNVMRPTKLEALIEEDDVALEVL